MLSFLPFSAVMLLCIQCVNSIAWFKGLNFPYLPKIRIFSMFKTDEFPYHYSMGYYEHREKSFLMALKAVPFPEENTNICTELEGYSSPLFYFYMQKFIFWLIRSFSPNSARFFPQVTVRCAVVFWTKNCSILSSASARWCLERRKIDCKCMVVFCLTFQQPVAQGFPESEVASKVLHLMDIMGTILHEIAFTLLNCWVFLVLSFTW